MQFIAVCLIFLQDTWLSESCLLLSPVLVLFTSNRLFTLGTLVFISHSSDRALKPFMRVNVIFAMLRSLYAVRLK